MTPDSCPSPTQGTSEPVRHSQEPAPYSLLPLTILPLPGATFPAPGHQGRVAGYQTPLQSCQSPLPRSPSCHLPLPKGVGEGRRGGLTQKGQLDFPTGSLPQQESDSNSSSQPDPGAEPGCLLPPEVAGLARSCGRTKRPAKGVTQVTEKLPLPFQVPREQTGAPR